MGTIDCWHCDGSGMSWETCCEDVSCYLCDGGNCVETRCEQCSGTGKVEVPWYPALFLNAGFDGAYGFLRGQHHER